ncbi:MAG: type II toxin-antitoxin system RelE/ParE family toxin [Gammaproteobacteria bacterium]
MTKQKELRYYNAPNGKAPFVKWLDKIKDIVLRSRIDRRLERLELGHYGDCKALGGELYELRLAFGSGYRVYFAEQANQIILLLCGGDKTTQGKDIEMARQYLCDFKERAL